MKKITTGILSAAILFQSGIYTTAIKAKDVEATQTKDEKEAAMQRIKESFTKYVAGSEQSNQNEALKSKIDATEKNAKVAFDTYLGNDQELFRGIDLSREATVDVENSDNLYKTTQNIYKMALAYATSGTSYYHKEQAKKIICEAISKFYTATFCKYYGYSDDGLVFGNWWNWEIGMPTQLTNTFVLMEKELNETDAKLISQYVAGFDNYLRNGKNGDVDLSAPQHTGTNLADITMNRILQGTLIKEETRIQKAADDMRTVFATIDPYQLQNGNSDGVYQDGSFIQHHRVAYTGSYGKLLLQRAVQSLVILNGTPWQPVDQLATLQDWIYHSFAPLLYEGYMMEIVKGRAVSRSATGYSDAAGVIESMALLTQFLPEDEKNKMESQIKFMVESMPTKLNANALTMAAILPYLTIMEDENIQPKSQLSNGQYAFNAMDKNVQIEDGFAFAISRSSNRISKYEYMSGENLKPWFQGDGANYLYLSGRDQTKSFGVNYMAAIDPYRLPGTTVPKEQRLTIPQMFQGSLFYPAFPAGSEEQNDYVYFPVGTNHFSGSVSLNGFGVAGMQLGDDNAYAAKQQGILGSDFIAYKNAEANKSWFMFGNKIVAVGSDIHDEKQRELTTTIDNRMSGTKETIQATGMEQDGKIKALENGVYEHLSWIHYQTDEAHTAVGYYFPQEKAIEVKKETRNANLQDIRTVSPSTPIQENFFTMTYDHGTNPSNDSYSYVILPNASEAETKQFAQSGDIKILEQSDQKHVVQDTSQNLTGYNFFQAGKSQGIEVSAPATLIKQQEKDTLSLALSDPLFDQEAITVWLDGTYKLAQPNSRVEASIENNRTKLVCTTAKLYGESIEVSLQKTTAAQQEETTTPEKELPNKETPKTPATKAQTPQAAPQKEEALSSSVDTGDHSNTWLPVTFLVVSFGTMSAVYKITKKKKS